MLERTGKSVRNWMMLQNFFWGHKWTQVDNTNGHNGEDVRAASHWLQEDPLTTGSDSNHKEFRARINRPKSRLVFLRIWLVSNRLPCICISALLWVVMLNSIWQCSYIKQQERLIRADWKKPSSPHPCHMHVKGIEEFNTSMKFLYIKCSRGDNIRQ